MLSDSCWCCLPEDNEIAIRKHHLHDRVKNNTKFHLSTNVSESGEVIIIIIINSIRLLKLPMGYVIINLKFPHE